MRKRDLILLPKGFGKVYKGKIPKVIVLKLEPKKLKLNSRE